MCLPLRLKHLGDSAELKLGTMACLSIGVSVIIAAKQLYSTRWSKNLHQPKLGEPNKLILHIY